jgi:hypothetical protein
MFFPEANVALSILHCGEKPPRKVLVFVCAIAIQRISRKVC